MRTSPPERPTPDWQLRIRASDGRTAGAGVLLSSTHVLTCAHVVSEALEESSWAADAPAPRPEKPVDLDAPRGDASWQAKGTVLDDGWFTDRSPWDVAVLRLDRPAEADPAVLHGLGEAERSRRSVSIVGFADDGISAGLWAYGLLGGRGGRRREYVQIDLESSVGARVVRGFSGSGVRENRSGALIGIVCDAYEDFRGLGEISWMIPIEAVPNVWNGSIGVPSAPVRSERQDLNAVILALCEVRTIIEPDRRTEFSPLLDRRVRGNVRLGLEPRLFSSQLVRVAREYGLLHDVLAALDVLEEGSRPMRQVWAVAEPLLRQDDVR